MSEAENYNIDEKIYTSVQNTKRHVFLGYKYLSPKDIKTFQFALNNAKLSSVNAEGRIENILEELVRNIIYLGYITIEDKISEDTKETISLLTKA